MRYRGFVSYSHSDSKAVARLHRWLESYRLPGRLRMPDGSRRIAPIFRDRDELPTSSDLGTQLVAALESSERLLLFCSPASARSKWVNEEAASFVRFGRGDRIIAILIDGDAAATDTGLSDDDRLPPALKELADSSGTICRCDLRDGREHYREDRLRIVSEIAGIDHHILQREDLRRGIRQAGLFAILAAGIAMTLTGLGAWAWKAANRAKHDTAVADLARVDATNAAYAARKAEAEAVAQERAASETTEFFVSIFHAFNVPAASKNVIFADLLEAACRRLLPNNGDVPAVQDPVSRARLLHGLGGALIVLGRTKLAEQAMQAAVDEASPSTLVGKQDLELLMTAAVAASDAEDHTKALALTDEARTIREESRSSEEDVDFRIATNRINCLIKLRRPVTEIEEQLRKARALNARLPNDRATKRLVALLKVEALFANELLSDGLTAEGKLREALAICDEPSYSGSWDDWPHIATQIANIHGATNAKEKISLIKKALAIFTARLGSNHPRAIDAGTALGLALSANEQHEEAISCLKECLESRTLADEEWDPTTRRLVKSLAGVYVSAERWTAAAPLLDLLCKDFQRRGQTNCGDFADVLEMQGYALINQGKTTEAIAAETQALEIRERCSGPDSLDLWDALRFLAKFHGVNGDKSQQVELLLRLLTILESKNLGVSESAVRVHQDLASAYADAGSSDKSLGHAARAVEICEASHIHGDRYAEALGDKGTTLCNLFNRYAEGIPLLTAATRIAAESHRPKSQFLQRVMSLLRNAILSAGAAAVLEVEFGDKDAAKEIFGAVQTGLEELVKHEAPGIALARSAKFILAESAVESAREIAADDPVAADILVGHVEQWLYSDETRLSPQEQKVYDEAVQLRAASQGKNQ